jgi:putative ABC transport system permease protein
MHTLLLDLRFAGRLLARSPTFTVVALATLAIGIAANAVLFSVVNALLLRPLPYADSERLVMLWQDLRARGGPENEWLAPAHFFDWRSRARSLEAAAVFRTAAPSLTGDGEPEQLQGWAVSADFFRVLSVGPALGRDFTADDDRPGAPRTAIVTHGLWTRRFGGDPSLVGRTIPLDREPVTVVGILPPSYRNPFDAPELFVPLQLEAAGASRGNITLLMIARLREGTPLDAARSELAAVGAAVAGEHPDTDRGATIRVTRLHDEVAGDVRAPLLALLGAVVLVLLIASANIANLQLARASVREREMAVRTALGASRARIVRQLLTESALLGLAGSTAGLLLAFWLLDGLLALAPGETVRLHGVRIDAPVLAFGVALALGASIVFGLAPALQSARRDVATSMKSGGRTAGGSREGARARSAFVVAELALALMLLVGAGLLVRTLANIRNVDPGFAPDRLLTALVMPPAIGYEKPPQIRGFHRALLERLEGAPGVQSVALVSVLPFSGEDTDTTFLIEGRPKPAARADHPSAWYRIVSAGYLRAMGTALEAGRFIEPADLESTERVAVVNRTLARRYWPDEDPVGRYIVFGDRRARIVGIVADVRHRTLREEPRGQLYLSVEQFTVRRMTVVMKTSGDPLAVAPVLRETVRGLDPYLPLSRVTTMEALMADTLAVPRLMTYVMTAFACVSLMLAAIGVYGLMAYTVTLRAQEFGVRLALGAASRDVIGLVVGHATRVAVAGLALGALASLGAARLIGALLFGVTASDAPTFAGTSALLAAIVLLASYLPARRAVRVDPVRALRSE